MIDQLIDSASRASPRRVVVATTLAALLLSQLLTTIIVLSLAPAILPTALFVAFVIPLIVAPLLSWVTTRVLARVRYVDEAYKAQVQRTALILRTALDAYILVDPAGNIIDANEAMAQITGLSVTDLCQMQIGQLDLRVSTSTLARLVEQVMGGETVRFVATIKHRQGQTAHIEVNMARLTFGDSRFVVAFARDISARMEAESRLAHSAAQFRTFFEKAPIGMSVFSLTGEFLQANAAFCHMTGYLSSELHTMQMRDIIYSEDWPLHERLGRFLIAGQMNDFEMEVRLTRPGGSLVHTLMKITLERDMAGNPVRFIGQALDISERKRVEEALRQSNERTQALLNAIPDSFFRFGADGTYLDVRLAEGDIAWPNPASKLIGRNVQEVAPSYLAEQAMQNITLALQTGRMQTFEFERTFDDGRTYYLEGRAVVSGPAEVTLVVRDLTERVEARRAIENERAFLAQRVAERTAELSLANAELGRALQARDDFLATISHELRTPLNAILGQCQLLQEGIHGPLTKAQIASLHIVEESGRHLLALISDILDAAKIASGQVRLLARPVNVPALCQSSLRLISQMANQKGLQVSYTPDPAVQVLVGDERRLKQILVNLLSNAVKFTPEKGQIGLEIEGDAPAGVARLTIWDTGIGIAKADMDRLFLPFVQLDSSLARQHEGTGLGLSLVNRLAILHHGSVTVESELGRGSRFTVTLPWHPAGAEPAPEADRDPAAETEQQTLDGGRSYTVLLAEDNEMSATTFEDYLLFYGYQVILARTGREAIRQAQEARPDLIMMDIQMPELNGLEAIRLLRSDPRTAHIPIIAITGVTMPGEEERCLAAGANSYLGKPIGLKQLLHTIEFHLSAIDRPVAGTPSPEAT